MSEQNQNPIFLPAQIGSIFEEMTDPETGRLEFDVPRKEYLLEDNPDLERIAETDEFLYSRLKSLRKARLDASEFSDKDRVSQQIFGLDRSTREYLQSAGYKWNPYYTESDPEET